jgi:ADP-ribose pyrophosphatase YjhB (NUDIX family)
MLQPRFCLRCGAAMEIRTVDDRPRAVCPACSYVHYVNPVVAAGTLVDRNGEVLLVRRGVPPGLGQWGLPAGYAEAGERPEETAVRETEEETGIKVSLDGLLGIYAFAMEAMPGGVLILYAAHALSGEPAAGDDAIEVRFFRPDDLPAEIAFATHRQALTQWARARTVTYSRATLAEETDLARLAAEAGLTRTASWGRYCHTEIIGGTHAPAPIYLLAREGIAPADDRAEQGIVGFVRMLGSPDMAQMRICAVYVRPGYRRWGIGSRLLHEAGDLARSAGAVQLVAETAADDPGMAFYVRLGFTVCGYNDDQPIGRVLLCRDLGQSDGARAMRIGSL